MLSRVLKMEARGYTTACSESTTIISDSDNTILVHFMGFAKAKFKVVGDKGSQEGTAIVDTGSLISVVDEALVDELGLKYTGRTLELTTLSGEEIKSNEALMSAFEVEGERLVSERVAICKLPNNVKEKLRAMEAHEQVIIGVITLEAAGLIVNTLKGRLEKVGWLAL